MSARRIRVELELGRTRFGQPVTAICDLDRGAASSWSITRADGARIERVDHLDDEHLLALADLVQRRRRGEL